MNDKRDLATRKFDALLGVAIDSDLPKLAARVMVLIATRYMNADHGGEAWPSIATLQRDLGIASDSAVRKALSALVSNGHLLAEHRAGATTRYSLPTDPASKCGEVEKRNPSQKRGGPPPIIEADTPLQNEADTPPIFEAINTGYRTPEKEHRIETPEIAREGAAVFELSSPGEGEKPAKKEKGRNKPISKPKSPLAGFEQFWTACLRKEGKRNAEKAYAAAMKRGADPAEILCGMMRYAAERDREPDPVKRHKFTKLPATWLNGEHWADEPAALASSNFSPHDRPERRSNHPDVYEMALAGRIK
jgi:hypothetical protein